MSNYYKPAKTPKEQIDYLKKTKNVVFNSINEEEAEEILKIFNYINVITPFKHHFYTKDNKGEPILDESGCHQYPNPIDFKQYFDLYKEERDSYPVISENLIRFETIFNSLLSLRILNNNNFDSNEKLENFLESIYQNLQNKYPARAYHYRKAINMLKSKYLDYHDIYCFLTA